MNFSFEVILCMSILETYVDIFNSRINIRVTDVFPAKMSVTIHWNHMFMFINGHLSEKPRWMNNIKEVKFYVI